MVTRTNDTGTTNAAWTIGNSNVATIDASGLTVARTVSLPDASGTAFLREDAGSNYSKLAPSSTPVFAGVDTALISHAGSNIGIQPGSGYDFDIVLPGSTSKAHVNYTESVSGQVRSLLTLTKNTSASLVAGEGQSIDWMGEDSTTADQQMAKRSTVWADPTHATRASRVIEAVYDTAARTCMVMEASGSAPMIGFLGANASARLASPDIGTALNTFGFTSGTPVYNGTVGATTPAAGTFTVLTVNGNTTLGDASGDTITQYASTRRLVSGETITVDSASTTAEVLQTWKLSDDAVGKFEIINSSATDGLFSPTFKGTRASAGPGINFIGNSTTDTGTNGVLLFQAQIGGGNVSTRPLVDFWNNGTSAFAIAANGDLSQKVVGNGQALTFASQTELLTIAASATSDTTFNLPAGAVIFAVSVRVTVVIPTASTFTVTGTTSGTTFSTAAVSTAANTTDKGTAAGAYYNASAQHVRITPNLTPAANTGRVRVTAHYYSITAPTS